MREKVKILTCCSHFDEIVNHDFLEDDIFTKKIIQYYQDFIFNIADIENNLSLIKDLDEALYKYIEDYRFAKSLKDTLDIDVIVSNQFDYLRDLMEYIIDFYKLYDDSSVPVTPTKWI